MKTTFYRKHFLAGLLAALGLTTLGSELIAQPSVDFAVSGTPGDYTLDFTVNNATPGTGNQDIYVFGVYDPNGTVTASPSVYTTPPPMMLEPFAFFGVGTTLTYNDGWFDSSFAALSPGTILSGFEVLDTSLVAPTSIPYVAVGYDGGGLYAGAGNLAPNSPANPLFEGNAVQGGGNSNARAADDGATMSMLAIALGAMGGVFRKLRKA